MLTCTPSRSMANTLITPNLWSSSGFVTDIPLDVRAGDPEPGVDDVLVLRQAVTLHRLLERGDGVVVAGLGVIDAAEVRERVEVVVRILIDAAQHALVQLLGARVLAAVVV